jgi:hypothetical protein
MQTPAREVPPNPSLQHFHDLWRSRLALARVSYTEAAERFRAAAEDFELEPAADRGTRLRRAVTEEALARNEYTRVLLLLTEVVMEPDPAEASD